MLIGEVTFLYGLPATIKDSTTGCGHTGEVNQVISNINEFKKCCIAGFLFISSNHCWFPGHSAP